MLGRDPSRAELGRKPGKKARTYSVPRTDAARLEGVPTAREPQKPTKAVARFEPYNGFRIEVLAGAETSREPTLKNSLTQAAPTESRTYEKKHAPCVQSKASFTNNNVHSLLFSLHSYLNLAVQSCTSTLESSRGPLHLARNPLAPSLDCYFQQSYRFPSGDALCC
jgi:hypothetical protein